ncbi:MAG: SPRY domain-containing protein, partial [archaeon]|nr:SPRY domain-containing protein [archaeon]
MPAASASPGSLFYFEIELLEVPTGDALAMGGSLQIGLSLSPISRGEVLGDPLACPPVGYVPGEYGYHGDDGSAFVGSYRGSPHLGPQYSVGDVVGCGVLNSGRVYFTLNGLFLDVVEGPVIPGMELHAAVSTSAGGAFRYRFQQPFLFQPPDLNAKVQWPFPLNSFALQLLASSPAFPSLLDSLDSLSHIAFWSLLAQHPAGDPSIDTHMSPSARETLAEALEKHPPTLFKRKFIEHQLIHAQSNRPLPAPSTRAAPSDTAALQFHNLDEQFGAISQLQSELHSIQLRLRQAMSDCLISAESAAPSAANLLGPSMSASRDSLTRSQEFLFEDSDK